MINYLASGLTLCFLVICSVSAQAENVQRYPDVVGQQISDVELLASNLGIRLKIEETDAAGVKGRVIEQIVNGGAKSFHLGGVKVGQFGACALERAALI